MTEAEAREQASRVATGNRLLERLAERVGATARASTVFGDPVEDEGVTVIPVARAKWGFGGGSGGREGELGAGGGGGTSVSPVGFIELRAGEARFRRITGRSQIVAVGLAALAGGLSTAIGLRLARKARSRAIRLVSAPIPPFLRSRLLGDRGSSHRKGARSRFGRRSLRPRHSHARRSRRPSSAPLRLARSCSPRHA
jgi:uncharacterized spore protein YtfJ